MSLVKALQYYLLLSIFQKWFGMARGACGGNDHPNPQTFLQIFRLLCSYSLIKPPRGSNIDGAQLLQALMQTKESMTAAGQPRRQWLEKIDRILDEAQFDHKPTPSCAADHEYTAPMTLSQASNHDPRKMMRWLKCSECIDTLQRQANEPSDPLESLIEIAERYGGLLRPSGELYMLTKIIEGTVLDVVGKFNVKLDTL